MTGLIILKFQSQILNKLKIGYLDIVRSPGIIE